MFSMSRILVPIDFSPCSRDALRTAIGFAEGRDATITLLHVLFDPVGPGELVSAAAGLVPIQRADIESTELLAKERLRELGDDVQRDLGTRVPLELRVVQGVPADAIFAACERHEMVVIGTHGRTGLAHLAIGSVAEQVVRRATVPVLSVRATPEALAEEKLQPAGILSRPPPVYALFDSPAALEHVYERLLEAKFLPEDISLMMTETTRDRDFGPIARTKSLEAAAAGGVLGGTLGGLLGGLSALGTALTGGIGILVLGPALALGAAGSMFGGLVGLGIPKDHVKRLQDALHEGKAFLAVHPRTSDEARRAHKILGMLHGEEFEMR